MTEFSHIHEVRLDRRALLRRLSLLGAGVMLSACAPADPSGSSSGAASAAPSGAGPTALDRVAPGTDPSLAVVAATFEQLVDQPNPFAFGLFTLEQEPVEGVDAQLYAVGPDGQAAGPWTATPTAADVPPGGLYSAPADFAATGVHEMVVVTADGRGGTVAVDVRSAETSQLPAPGEQAQAVATPTTADDLGYDRLCTRTPEPCGMHEVSLDDALAGGGPVAMLFATPAFCQTAVCGPTVDIIEQVRRDGFDDVTFVHCEIFADAGQTVGDPVLAWNLPTEPWLFVIDAGGGIVRRADGPLLVMPDQVRSLIRDGLAA
jgi:hypothetical protein